MFTYSSSYALDVKTYIPKNAIQFLPIVKEEATKFFPELPVPWYFGGLIEHESCVDLESRKCWNPKSELKTKREQGLGLGQITRTWNTDGSVRFDVLSDIRKAHMNELKELSWSNVRNRPDLQIRAIMIMSRTNYKALYMVDDLFERLAMTDAAYNGGLGGVRKERTACGLATNCDPDRWFNNVENYCLKSKKVLYAGRSSCDINRHHVSDILNTRMPKYQQYFN